MATVVGGRNNIFEETETMSVKEMKLESLTIDGARAAVASGEMTATGIAELHYALIASQDGEINSFLALGRERAIAQAAKIDGMAARAETLPALAGVPVGIKDVLVMEGAPATAGSLVLKGYRPPYDATVVTKLEAAGAVLLGKLNCDEFAMGSSNENSAYGSVLNPKALDRVPGGSSAARLLQWRRILQWRRWGQILAGRFGSRRLFVGWLACCRPMGESAVMD